MPVRYRTFLSHILPLCGLAQVVDAQQFQHIQAYREPTAQGSKFGWSIATTDDHLIVGSPHAASQAGSVAVFPLDDLAWTTVSGVSVSEGNTAPPVDQRFGAVVAASGDFVAVGSCSAYGTDQYCNDAAQWVSIYRNQGGAWQYAQSIQAPVGATGNFGKALAISTDHLAIGGSRLSVGGIVQDVVFLYAREGDQWALIAQDTLIGSAPLQGANAAFGHSLAMRSSLLLVGVSGDDELGTDCGAAYLFGRDQGGSGNWGLLRKLLPSDGTAGDRFGFSVALTDERAVVGAPLRMNGTDAHGGAYVFHRDAGAANNWGEVARMTPSDPHANMQYGASVALNDERIAVGAPFDVFSENGTDGSVEVFTPQGDTWVFAQRIVPYFDGHVSQVSRSGTSLAFARDKLLIGAPFAIVDEDTATPTGAVLVYGDPALGMRETSGTGVLNLYPDPFTDQASVILAEPSGGRIIMEVLDPLGRTAWIGTTNAAQTMSLGRNGLAAGAYTLLLREHGTRRVLGTSQFVIE